MKLFFQQYIKQSAERKLLQQADRLLIPLANESIQPFFILSAGRSGTTLLRKMLSNSNELHIPPESDDLIPMNAIYFIRNNAIGWESLVNGVVQNFKQAPCFAYWHYDLESVREELLKVGKPSQSFSQIISVIYQAHCQQKKTELKCWGDKTPYLMYHLTLLRAVFPKAKYIHLVRDGRAVVHSMMNKQGASIRNAAVRWRDSIHLFNEHSNFVDNERLLVIKYEDFIHNTSSILERICDFLGVRFSSDFTVNDPGRLGDDVLIHHESMRKSIEVAKINEWKSEIDAASLKWLNKVLRKELKELGYA